MSEDLQPICPDCRDNDDGSRTCDPSLRLCPLSGNRSNTAHVVPRGDAADHQTDDDCLCGPTPEPVPRDDGSIGWVMVHHSLDGREAAEEAP